MLKENYTKTMRLAGQLIAAGNILKAASSDLLPSDRRTSELMDLARMTVEKAVLSAWEKAESEPIEPD